MTNLEKFNEVARKTSTLLAGYAQERRLLGTVEQNTVIKDFRHVNPQIKTSDPLTELDKTKPFVIKVKMSKMLDRVLEDSNYESAVSNTIIAAARDNVQILKDLDFNVKRIDAEILEDKDPEEHYVIKFTCSVWS